MVGNREASTECQRWPQGTWCSSRPLDISNKHEYFLNFWTHSIAQSAYLRILLKTAWPPQQMRTLRRIGRLQQCTAGQNSHRDRHQRVYRCWNWGLTSEGQELGERVIARQKKAKERRKHAQKNLWILCWASKWSVREYSQHFFPFPSVFVTRWQQNSNVFNLHSNTSVFFTCFLIMFVGSPSWWCIMYGLQIVSTAFSSIPPPCTWIFPFFIIQEQNLQKSAWNWNSAG